VLYRSQGPGIQETYQVLHKFESPNLLLSQFKHAAYPMGFRIAATARSIDSSMNSKERVSCSTRLTTSVQDASPALDGETTHQAIVEHPQVESHHSLDSPMPADSTESLFITTNHHVTQVTHKHNLLLF
jgi:hypothetical protein